MNDLKESEIIEQWTELTQKLIDLSETAIATYNTGDFIKSENAYNRLIEHIFKLKTLLAEIKSAPHNEIAENSEADNLFKSSTQKKLSDDLDRTLSISYTYKALSFMNQEIPKFNYATHSYIAALNCDEVNQTAKNGALLCIENAAKTIILNEISVLPTEQNLNWAYNNNLGYSLLISKPVDAVAAFQKALGYIKHPGTYYGLGVAYFHNGLQQEALGAWREVKKIDDNYNFDCCTVAVVHENKFELN